MIMQGDVREQLATLADESVQCVVTSPPYWGLRDYKLESQIWPCDDAQGDSGCEHEWGEEKLRPIQSISDKTGLHNDGRSTPISDKYRDTLDNMTLPASHGQSCLKCNAWRGSLGMEPTLELYIQHVVAIFREVRRVLRKDGVFFLNMGDSYAANRSYQVTDSKHRDVGNTKASSVPAGLKPKDLCGIPWRLALALQADGWWLRSDIVWSKPNPMPESCQDRPTSSHEYLFFLVKSGTPQYWTHRDLPGVRRRPSPDYRWLHAGGYEVDVEPDDWRTSIITCPLCGGTGRETLYSDQESLFGSDTILGYADCRKCNKRRSEAAIIESDEVGHEGRTLPPGEVFEWDRINLWRGHDYFYDAEAVREPGAVPTKMPDGWDTGAGAHGTIHRKGREKGKKAGRNERYAEKPIYGRNMRSVWEIATQPFPEAHFATFPEKLVQRCIMAGTSEKGCCECGAPWARVVEKIVGSSKECPKTQAAHEAGGGVGVPVGTVGKSGGGRTDGSTKTVGWQPTCECPSTGSGQAQVVPCVVLDPFLGSGTVGKVAQDLGRDWIGIELSPEYCEMARKRTMHRQEVMRLV